MTCDDVMALVERLANECEPGKPPRFSHAELGAMMRHCSACGSCYTVLQEGHDQLQARRPDLAQLAGVAGTRAFMEYVRAKQHDPELA
jgi:hypothetical protein